MQQEKFTGKGAFWKNYQAELAKRPVRMERHPKALEEPRLTRGDLSSIAEIDRGLAPFNADFRFSGPEFSFD